MTFLNLPLDMRLEIYSHCTVLTLLILTHTSRTLYTDINSRSSVLSDTSRGPDVFMFNPWDSSELDKRNEKFTNHPMLPETTFLFTIPMLACKDSDILEMEEVACFNRVYAPRRLLRKGFRGCEMSWWCCGNCGIIEERGGLRVENGVCYGKDCEEYVQQKSTNNINFQFLSLPLEMRLEVYDNCSLLELYTLTHTCRTIYTDINNCKSLVKRSKGYSYFIKKARNKRKQPHPMLPASSVPLTLRMMEYHDKISHEDISHFNWTFAAGHIWNTPHHTGWWCCERCGRINWMEAIRTRSQDGNLLWKDCDECEVRRTWYSRFDENP
ncbi:hypothetical protein BJ508DRAFT_335265 [Ascobolus immersus RN42]|uniref:F-box domain-containing protein n=1 Tax=Ascobolus immersus RN42 TaxID=1160509 RepID=A0A3N4HJ67_ASCIM|nr:hypothetical protein BJ508DRAFT_335265 [Ascobolus immersus RN42]